MSSQTALIIQSPKRAALVHNWPVPAIPDDYILVKPVAVAVNPCDWKQVDHLGTPGVLLGCDFAGFVEAVGTGVKRKKTLQRGDAVCGFAHGANASRPETGAFATTGIIVKGNVQIRMPDRDQLSFEQAATLGVGIATVALGLYQNLELAWPTPTQPDLGCGGGTPILIYGGSTATGALAIQFARLSGYHVYTTCSRTNFDLVRNFGAHEVFDYHDSEAAAARIRDSSNNALKLVFDTISDEASANFCSRAISTEGGDYSHVNQVPASSTHRADVRCHFAGAFTVFGEDFKYGDTTYLARPDDKMLMEEFVPVVEDLLARGLIQPHRVTLGGGGLRGVLDGMQRLKEGKVSGEKLVYRVDETE